MKVPWKDNHRNTLLLLGFDEDLVDTVLEVRRKSEEEIYIKFYKLRGKNKLIINKFNPLAYSVF